MRQLEIDEGRRLNVYLDTEGLRTVGIGHLIKESDPPEIRDLKVGDKITLIQCQTLFEKDLATAITDYKVIFPQWETFPAEVSEIFINMLFNIGRQRFLGFKKMIAAAYDKNWNEVANQMEDSKWYHQVGNRAVRLVNRMRTMHDLAKGV